MIDMNMESTHPKPFFVYEKGFTSKFIGYISSSESKVKEYCNHIKQKTDLAIASNNVYVQNDRKEIQNLIHQLKSIQAEIGIISNGGKDSNKGISSEKLCLKDRQEALNQEGSMIRKEINQCKRDLYFTKENERESLSKAEEVRAVKRRVEESKAIDTNDLTLGVSYYKKLGLDFCKLSETNMKITFSKFDPNDKNRTASIILAYRDDSEVEVEDCFPSLRVTTLRTLVDYLNADYSNNVPTFLLRMRKAFSTEGHGY